MSKILHRIGNYNNVSFLPAATFGAVRSTGAKVLDVGGGGLEYSEMSRRNKSIGPSTPTFWWWRYIVSRQNITDPSAPSFFHMLICIES